MKITCNDPYCDSWATSFITVTRAPLPEPVPDADLIFPPVAPQTLWYACDKHKGPRHLCLPQNGNPPVCEHCGSQFGVTWQDSRTAYDPAPPSVWDHIRYGEMGPPDPNRCRALCPDCADVHHEYWDEMWADYNSSRL
jgi:hypothetical protein